MTKPRRMPKDHPSLAEAKRVLEVEAAAILGLVDHLDGTFVDVVELINGSNGRVITMGLGTLIAMVRRSMEARKGALIVTAVSAGAVELSRDVPAGEAVVVEVPLDATPPPAEQLTLRGKLTAELDQIIRIFQVSAKIAPK